MSVESPVDPDALYVTWYAKRRLPDEALQALVDELADSQPCISWLDTPANHLSVSLDVPSGASDVVVHALVARILEALRDHDPLGVLVEALLMDKEKTTPVAVPR